MGLAPPEQQPVRHRFNISQDGGAGGGITGHHLEKRVGKRGDRPVEHKRQPGQRRDQEPAEDSDKNTVFYIQLFLAAEKEPQGQADTGGDQRRVDNGPQVILTVINGADGRHEHGTAGNY